MCLKTVPFFLQVRYLLRRGGPLPGLPESDGPYLPAPTSGGQRTNLKKPHVKILQATALCLDVAAQFLEPRSKVLQGLLVDPWLQGHAGREWRGGLRLGLVNL